MSTNANTGAETTGAATVNKAEKAVAYAALILADADTAITPEKLMDLLKAANIEDVEQIWTTLFAKALEGKNVMEILTTIPTSAPEVGRRQLVGEGKEKEEDEGEVIVEGGECDEVSDAEEGMFDLFG